MAAPQAMKSPTAADRRSVGKSDDIEEDVVGQRWRVGAPRQPTTRQVLVYIRFFMYQGYDKWKNRKAHCTPSKCLMG